MNLKKTKFVPIQMPRSGRCECGGTVFPEDTGYRCRSCKESQLIVFEVDIPSENPETFTGRIGLMNYQKKKISIQEEVIKLLDETNTKLLAELEGQAKDDAMTIAAPPDNSRKAFEAWATRCGFAVNTSSNDVYYSRATRKAYCGWLAALEWRGSKPVCVRTRTSRPEKIAEAKHDVAECWRLEVCGIPVGWHLSRSDAYGDAAIINKAHGCEEATDGN